VKCKGGQRGNEEVRDRQGVDVQGGKEGVDEVKWEEGERVKGIY